MLLCGRVAGGQSAVVLVDLLRTEPLMIAAGVRGKAGLAAEPWLDSKGLPASSSGYLNSWSWIWHV